MSSAITCLCRVLASLHKAILLHGVHFCAWFLSLLALCFVRRFVGVFVFMWRVCMHAGGPQYVH